MANVPTYIGSDLGVHPVVLQFTLPITVSAGLISESLLGKDKASHLGGESFFLYGENIESTIYDDDFFGFTLNSALWSSNTAGTGSILVSNSPLTSHLALNATSRISLSAGVLKIFRV